MSTTGSGQLMGEGKQTHDKTSILLLALSGVMFIIMAVFNALAGSGAAVPEIFLSTVGNMSDKYDTMITPAGFTFSIWSIIYLWLALSLVLLVVTLFLNNSMGMVYLNPPFATPLVSGITIINFILNLTWIFVWDREHLVVACVVLVSICATGMTIIGLMARNIQKHEEVYKRGGSMFAWGVVYRVIMNGWGIYTTWCVIASLINLTTALVYRGDTDMKATCLAALSLLIIFHVTWFILENFVFDKYVRWLLTPYMVVIWASNGVRVNIQERESTTPPEIKDFVLSILAIANLTLAVRLVSVFAKTFISHKRQKNVVKQGCC